MSAKLLYTLSDENPDLHKQIGCMNGIFQLFDCHRYLSSPRIVSHSHKRLPPGRSQSYNNRSEPSFALQKTTEKPAVKTINEKQPISNESSITSVSSSSCSSSISSADYCRTSEQEPLSFGNRILHENAIQESPTYQPNGSSQQSWKSLDLRDVVKDSIHREARGLLVKTTTKEEIGFPTLKYVDSPRPVPQAKFTKNRASLLNESFQASNLERNGGCQNLAPKGTPPLSYDERAPKYGHKYAIQQEELPRLSLDSKEDSIKSCSTEIKQNYIFRDLQRENGNSHFLTRQQESESYRRTSSVVAKLMGLEVLHDSISSNQNEASQIKSFPDVENGSLPRSSSKAEHKQNCVCNSPTLFHTEAGSPRMGNADSMKKPVVHFKFPKESAPWKQPDGSKVNRLASKAQTKPLNSSLSAYGEIKKRLAELEIKKSGNDLRALKRILEAMETTQQLSETRDKTSDSTSIVQNSSSPAWTTNMAKNTWKNHKSPIVIMKPVKGNEKLSDPTFGSIRKPLSVTHRIRTKTGDSRKDMTGKQTTKDLPQRPNHYSGSSNQSLHPLDKNISGRPLQSRQALNDTHPNMRETLRSGKSSKNVNQRLQQKKIGFEDQSHPGRHSSDSSNAQRRPRRQQMESLSPSRKPRPKLRNQQQSDNVFIDISSDRKNLCHRGDTSLLQSESNISPESFTDTEVTSKVEQDRIRDTSEQHTPKQKNPGSGFSEDRQMADPVKITLEQPSPVSVLDATFNADESLSPVKKISNAFKDEGPLSLEKPEWITEDLNYYSGTRNPSLISQYVQNLNLTDSSPEEIVINESTTPNDSRNPDHRYISDILLASGILSDPESNLMTMQLHQSCPPINPKLFSAFEQSKTGTEILKDNKRGKKVSQTEHAEVVRRKLIFDTINEILGSRLVFKSFSKPCIPPKVLLDKRPKGHAILQTLCSEVDRLLANHSNCSLDDEDTSLKSLFFEDLMHQEWGWTELQGEIPGIVLDVERLIFKDLISEVVNREIVAIRERPGRHHRQQSSK